MKTPPQLHFPSFIFRLRLRNGVQQIWDPLRGAWLDLTPEEWVRQHLVRYLQENQGILPTLIVQEHPVALGGTNQRADVVVYDTKAQPRLVIECKAPDVPLDAAVFAQVVRYNFVLQAPCVAITNGMTHLYTLRDPKTGRYGPVGNLLELSLAGID